MWCDGFRVHRGASWFFQRLRASITLFFPIEESNAQYCTIFVLRQTELTNGAKIFLGGLEAAELACDANPANISLIVDVRGQTDINRWKEPHFLKPPENVRYHNFAVNSFCYSRDGISPKYSQGFATELAPMFRTLCRGEHTLVHCHNGKNRSAMLALIQHDGGYRR